MSSLNSIRSQEEHVSFDKSKEKITLFHRRMGPPHLQVLKEVSSFCNSFLSLNKIQFLPFCDACQQGKIHNLNFKNSYSRALEPFELLHLDL